MPAIPTSSKVLLTGGSGFLGAWILKELLERGFNVRAAVRNESKAIYLRDAFKTHSDKLELVIVEDITVPGAFDEAVKGVTGIIHSASPLSGNDPLIDPKALIEPAVNGTIGILNSAQKSPSVERVVITSSVTALWDRTKQLPFVYTEDVWNIPAVKIVEEQGKEAPLFTKYAASKTLAEQGAWQLIKDTNPQFDLVTVLPSFIWGQIISETTADIKGSNGRLLRLLKREEQDKYKGEALLEELYLVDVRDVSKLHVDGLVIPVAGGQRIVASAATIAVQHIYDILNATPINGLDVPRGERNLLNNWAPKTVFSGQKSVETIGIRYRPVEETIRNTLIHALEIGWTQ